jgi:hypothetical protein
LTSDNTALYVGLAFGVGAVFLGMLVRIGRLRNWYFWYTSAEYNTVGRAALLLIPFGATTTVCAVGALLLITPFRDFGWILLLLGFALVPIDIVMWFRVPLLLQPNWFRDVQAGRAPAPRLDRPYAHLSKPQYNAGWVLLFGAAAAVILLDLPKGLLIGLGFAASLLIAVRPDARSPKGR